MCTRVCLIYVCIYINIYTYICQIAAVTWQGLPESLCPDTYIHTYFRLQPWHGKGFASHYAALYTQTHIHIHTYIFQIAAVTWQGLRQSLCRALHREKDEQINSILLNTYPTADVVCIQEAAAAYVERVLSHPVLSGRYMVLHPQVRVRVYDICIMCV